MLSNLLPNNGQINSGVRNSAPALSQKERGCPSGHITADKRKIKDFPKLPSPTSFIRKPLYAIGFVQPNKKYLNNQIKIT